MKIALIYLGRRGGGAKFSLELARSLTQIVQVRAFLSDAVENRKSWENANLKASFFPVFTGWAQAVLFSLLGQRLRGIVQAVRDWAPDILLITMFHPWNGLLQHALAAVPAVVIVHDPLPHPGFTGWLYGLVENISLRSAARGIVLSKVLESALENRGISKDRIGIIPHGILDFYPSESRQAVQSLNGPILFFGRITPYKGLEYLLKAFRIVKKQQPDLRLQIVGEGDLQPYRQELAGLEGIELINRWVSDAEIPSFFCNARMAVLPYTSATQSGVIPVAASFGLPVIATQVGGLVEQIDHLRTGLLVPAGDEQALASAIVMLANDPGLGKRLGAALKTEFEENRNWQLIAGQVLVQCQYALNPNGKEDFA